ncbi:RNA polymerase sigma-70 factor [Pseudochryseolinea flava]|uniref:RNA polymerase sigma-70 factor n=1 Tax=Pseudochryseolinea flava TaxID=2059302 RepID=A0A364XY43_9BACT|nr:RNA polymerase sigma-70 factor [Pseudochryseolinea flava]RAV99215.1 RNA polymerase sigma-70 factor [Pseudochryseolinea flava]
MIENRLIDNGRSMLMGEESPVDEVARIVDEEVLIRKTFEHDPQEGCELLFRKYYTILCSHAVRFVYSHDVAEDLVSEIFCKFWNDQIYASITTSYRAYLFKAVRYSAYNYVKWELSRRNKTVSPEEHLFDISSLKPEQALLYDELAHEINQIIDNLPNQCKRVFLLSRFENKKYKEIADELGISVKAVEAHISKALDILRRNLKSEDLLVWLILFGSMQ